MAQKSTAFADFFILLITHEIPFIKVHICKHDSSCLHQVTGATNIALSMLADMWMVFSSFFGGKPDKPPGKDRWGARRVQKPTSQNTSLRDV